MERVPHTLKALNETFSSKEMMKKPKKAVKPAPCVYPGQHVLHYIHARGFAVRGVNPGLCVQPSRSTVGFSLA